MGWYRNNPSEVLSEKRALKLCSTFTGKHPYRSANSIKLQSNFIEIALWHGCSPVNLLHIFRLPFPKSIFGEMFLMVSYYILAKITSQTSPDRKKVYEVFITRKQNNCGVFSEISQNKKTSANSILEWRKSDKLWN